MIQVLTFYQDIYGVKIQPGFYELNDPRLKNQGQALLASGQAVEVKSLDNEKLTGVNNSDDESEAVSPAPEFTRFALDLMATYDLTEDELIAYYPDVDKFLKSHVEDYLADTID